MKLHPPFIITARLLPGLRLGEATLHFDGAKPGDDLRMRACMILDLPGGVEYIDETLQSGQGGFQSVVDIFENYLGFLSHAVDHSEWKQRNPGLDVDPDLFPPNVTEWAVDNADEIGMTLCDLQDESGRVLQHLIES